jgi:nucleotide-binding universal stress UspA family protein
MKLLIGYDGSPGADAALFDLTRAGLPPEGRACVISIVPPLVSPEALAMDPTGAGWLAAAYAAGADDKEALEAALETGRKAAQYLREHFPKWEVDVETGVEVAAHALLNKAEAWKPDLIALGSHGWTWLGGMFIGSTAQKVLGHAHASVRLCRPKPGPFGAAPRIVIGVDGSKDAEAAIAAVAARNWPQGTEVMLLAAVDFRLTLSEAIADGKTPAGPSDSWPWMEKNLRAAAARLMEKGLSVKTSILEGDPRQVLLKQAHEFNADAIFMGRRGLSGFGRLMMGSVSGNVASHAPCSVEIVIGK